MSAVLLAVMLAVTPTEGERQIVSVQMEGGAERVAPSVMRARALATQMFATAGVQLEWCEQASKCQAWADRIVVRLQRAAPGHLPATALADAQAFEGRHVSIYLDRMPPISHASSSSFWAHVLVHEITHLLQASDHHAETGVMKAHWNARDLAGMRFAPLPFTPFDIRMLHAGLSYRRPVAPALPEAAR